jgi:uncharacterized protein (TIGR03032 family)
VTGEPGWPGGVGLAGQQSTRRGSDGHPHRWGPRPRALRAPLAARTRGQLWLLQSGTRQLVLIGPASGRRQVATELPGFTRGLAFVGPSGFVALAKIRPTSAMGGVPLVERRGHLKRGLPCGRANPQMCALLEFQTAVEEIYDLEFLAGPHLPDLMGLQRDTLESSAT